MDLRSPTLLRTLLLTGAAAWAALLVSCVVSTRSLLAPPHMAGAEFVGSQSCTKCHAAITRGFHDATHAHLNLKSEDGAGRDAACESCHGGGSLHVKAGTRQTILNPKRSPDTCLQCHPGARAEFSLPHTHPVLGGKISCTNCHDPHQGDAAHGSGLRRLVASANATCAQSHPAQSGQFVFTHEVMREGCVTCHSPHGSVNSKLLRARGASLCYQCHFQPQGNANALLHGGFNHAGGQGNIVSGTCWNAGCHEAVHGSNVNSNLRF